MSVTRRWLDHSGWLRLKIKQEAVKDSRCWLQVEAEGEKSWMRGILDS